MDGLGIVYITFLADVAVLAWCCGSVTLGRRRLNRLTRPMGSCLPTLRRAIMPLALVFILAFPVTGMAAPKGDPFEGANRQGYAIHQFLDRTFLRPAAKMYQALVPSPIRTGLRHVISNMGEPGVMANDLLQGHPVRAGKTLTRFVANTTIGVGGLFDVSTPAGLPHHDNGFGDTLGRYGAGPGPYLFVPLVGPSTVRDLLGHTVDVAADPLFWTQFRQRTLVIDTRTVVGGLDERGQADPQLKAIDAMSTDGYATLRSLYLQNRAAEIADITSGGAGGGELILPDFDDPASAPTPVAPLPTAVPPPRSSDAQELDQGQA